MQRRVELDAPANDLAFLERDYGRDDFDAGFRARACANQFLEDAIVFRAAIGITGAVFGDGADVDRMSAEDFSPADRYGKKVSVAKRHISNGDGAVVESVGRMIFRDGDIFVGKRHRTANGNGFACIIVDSALSWCGGR